MNRQTWFVTGAASRLGADIVRQALAAGHQVVAADADPLAALRRIGDVADERLLALPLDEVDAHAVGIAVKAAVARFGGIDVLVHGAADCSPQSGVRRARARARLQRLGALAVQHDARRAGGDARAGRRPHPPPGAGAGHASAGRRCSRSPASARRWPRTSRRSASRCRRCRRTRRCGCVCPQAGRGLDELLEA